MNTLYFKYALEVEAAGSITQAAQKLFMAQPNLSKAIKDLEGELGFSIFKRSPNGIKPTEQGVAFLYHAKKVMEQLGEMEKIYQQGMQTNFSFKLSIPRGSYIASAFASFVDDLVLPAGTEISISETNTLQTIANVMDNGYNLGIIRYHIKDEDYFQTCFKNYHLTSETIWEFGYVLLMSKKSPLASKDVITPDDLADYVELTHGDIELPYTRGIDDTCATPHRSKTIYVYERGSQFDLLINVPSTYMWVSPIPEPYLQRLNLVQKKCSFNSSKYKDVLIYRNDYELTSYDHLLRNKLYESKNQVATLVL